MANCNFSSFLKKDKVCSHPAFGDSPLCYWHNPDILKEHESVAGELQKIIDATGGDLEGFSLRKANLSGLNLSGANMKDVDLREGFLDGANLSGADLRGAKLNRVTAVGANFEGANLMTSSLTFGNFTNANFRNVNFRIVHVGYANFSGADFTGSDRRHTEFIEAQTSGMKVEGGAEVPASPADSEVANAPTVISAPIEPVVAPGPVPLANADTQMLEGVSADTTPTIQAQAPDTGTDPTLPMMDDDEGEALFGDDELMVEDIPAMDDAGVPPMAVEPAPFIVPAEPAAQPMATAETAQRPVVREGEKKSLMPMAMAAVVILALGGMGVMGYFLWKQGQEQKDPQLDPIVTQPADPVPDPISPVPGSITPIKPVDTPTDPAPTGTPSGTTPADSETVIALKAKVEALTGKLIEAADASRTLKSELDKNRKELQELEWQVDEAEKKAAEEITIKMEKLTAELEKNFWEKKAERERELASHLQALAGRLDDAEKQLVEERGANINFRDVLARLRETNDTLVKDYEKRIEDYEEKITKLSKMYERDKKFAESNYDHFLVNWGHYTVIGSPTDNYVVGVKFSRLPDNKVLSDIFILGVKGVARPAFEIVVFDDDGGQLKTNLKTAMNRNLDKGLISTASAKWSFGKKTPRYFAINFTE